MGSTEKCEVCVHSHLSLRNWNFPSSWWATKRKCLAYTRFFDHPFVAKGNELHNRNQHRKLHRRTLNRWKENFRKNSTRGGPQAKILWKTAEGEYRSDFDENFFLANAIFADVVFGADSEYRIHFPRTWVADRKNGCTRGIFSSFLTTQMETFNFSGRAELEQKPRTSLYCPWVAGWTEVWMKVISSCPKQLDWLLSMGLYDHGHVLFTKSFLDYTAWEQLQKRDPWLNFRCWTRIWRYFLTLRSSSWRKLRKQWECHFS